MKSSRRKFIFAFTVCFFLMSLMAVAVLDNSSGEMVIPVIFGNLIYSLLSIPAWIGIKMITRNLKTFLKLFVQFFVILGLTYIFVFALSSDWLPLALISPNTSNGSFKVSLGIHIIYFFSFLIAALTEKHS
jgi:hypothetical protein